MFSCLAALNENGDVDAGLTGSPLAAGAGAPKRDANEGAEAVEAAPAAGGPNEKPDGAGLLSVFTPLDVPLWVVLVGVPKRLPAARAPVFGAPNGDGAAVPEEAAPG